MIKTLKLLLVLSSIIYAQDKMRMDGKDFKGKYISVDFENEKFTFHLDGQKKASILPLDYNRLDYIQLANGEYKLKNPNITAREEKEAEAKRIEQLKASCDEKKAISVSILPFVNDFYGVTDWVSDTLYSWCYGVEPSNIKVLEWLDKHNIKLKDINDYHIFKAQKALGIDRIYNGYVHINEIQNHSLNELGSMNWVYLTVFYLDSDTGARNYLFNRTKIFWF